MRQHGAIFKKVGTFVFAAVKTPDLTTTIRPVRWNWNKNMRQTECINK
jgi:hypothetical protein